jgi:hypothetical protein
VTLTSTKTLNAVVELFKTITPSLKKKASAKKGYYFAQQHPSS